ncbi:hypothetical protein ACG0S7_28510, partial [Klebsiella pneumoniae]
NIRETTLRAVMEDYADFGGLLRDLPNALKKAGSTPEVFEKTFDGAYPQRWRANGAAAGAHPQRWWVNGTAVVLILNAGG